MPSSTALAHVNAYDSIRSTVFSPISFSESAAEATPLCAPLAIASDACDSLEDIVRYLDDEQEQVKRVMAELLEDIERFSRSSRRPAETRPDSCVRTFETSHAPLSASNDQLQTPVKCHPEQREYHRNQQTIGTTATSNNQQTTTINQPHQQQQHQNQQPDLQPQFDYATPTATDDGHTSTSPLAVQAPIDVGSGIRTAAPFHTSPLSQPIDAIGQPPFLASDFDFLVPQPTIAPHAFPTDDLDAMLLLDYATQSPAAVCGQPAHAFRPDADDTDTDCPSVDGSSPLGHCSAEQSFIFGPASDHTTLMPIKLSQDYDDSSSFLEEVQRNATMYDEQQPPPVDARHLFVPPVAAFDPADRPEFRQSESLDSLDDDMTRYGSVQRFSDVMLGATEPLQQPDIAKPFKFESSTESTSQSIDCSAYIPCESSTPVQLACALFLTPASSPEPPQPIEFTVQQPPDTPHTDRSTGPARHSPKPNAKRAASAMRHRRTGDKPALRLKLSPAALVRTVVTPGGLLNTPDITRFVLDMEEETSSSTTSAAIDFDLIRFINSAQEHPSAIDLVDEMCARQGDAAFAMPSIIAETIVPSPSHAAASPDDEPPSGRRSHRHAFIDDDCSRTDDELDDGQPHGKRLRIASTSEHDDYHSSSSSCSSTPSNVAMASAGSSTATIKRGRGRPASTTTAKQAQAKTPAVPKRRGRPPKTEPTPISTAELVDLSESDARYVQMRNKNNEASRRSRLNRKDREQQFFDEARELEDEHDWLLTEERRLEQRCQLLRKYMLEWVAA